MNREIKFSKKYPLCLYTGLKDKHGNEIYEGDILSQDGTIIGFVSVSLAYGFSIQKNSTAWHIRNFVSYSDFESGVLSDIEVVGTYTKTPELLKQ